MYTYDSVFGLKSESYYNNNNVFDYKNVYSYDLNGNILSIDNVTEDETLLYKDTYYYSSDVPNRLEDVKRTQGSNINIIGRLVHSDSIYPDAYVNQTNTFSLQWEGNKLVRCGGYYYKYNENGQRVSALNSSGYGKRYYYEGERLICVNHSSSNTSENVLYHYDENGSLIGLNYDNKEYFIDRDITGNINRIIDETGRVYINYIYNAYGKFQSIVNNNLTSDYIQIANNLITMNVMLYKGYCYDKETGLYYCKTRFYSPELCRWISPDSIEYLNSDNINGLNLYCYCMNNPIAYNDPNGLNPVYNFYEFLFTPKGGTHLQIVISIDCYIMMCAWALGDLIFNNGEGAWNDMSSIKWNPFNEDEEKTINSKNISFYKGVPVFMKNKNRPWSFGAIFFTKGYDEKDLRHERGHNYQLMMMGVGTYSSTVAIPSSLKLGPWAEIDYYYYYYAPWETMADILGGVTERYGKPIPNLQIETAWIYYVKSRLFFPLTIYYWRKDYEI